MATNMSDMNIQQDKDTKLPVTDYPKHKGFQKIDNDDAGFDAGLVTPTLAICSRQILIRETGNILHRHPSYLNSVAIMDQWYNFVNASQ